MVLFLKEVYLFSHNVMDVSIVRLFLLHSFILKSLALRSSVISLVCFLGERTNHSVALIDS